MTIRGAFQTERTNDYGYTSIKVSGTWYGADKKGFKPGVSEGDLVEFEAFDKPGNGGKVYPTYKSATFKKTVPAPGAPPVAKATGGKSSYAAKEGYWEDKAASDAAKEPRISYFAAIKPAIEFIDLALRNGALESYQKAKATGKLEILEALLSETTQRFITEAYAQKVPVLGEVKAEVIDESTAEAPEQGETDWS